MSIKYDTKQKLDMKRINTHSRIEACTSFCLGYSQGL